MASLAGDQGRFSLGVLAIWLLGSLFGWLVDDWSGVAQVTIAVALCLIPGWVTILAAWWLKTPQAAMIAMVFGMMLRLVCCGVGLFAVTKLWPAAGPQPFAWWLMGVYLATLALETRVLVTRARQLDSRTGFVRE